MGRRITTAALVGLLVTMVVAGCKISGVVSVKEIAEELDGSGVQEVSLVLKSSNISVTASDAATIGITGTARAKGQTKDATDAFLEAKGALTTTKEGTTLVITAPEGAWDDLTHSLSFDLKLAIPKTMAVTISTTNGNVEATGMAAPLGIQTSNGRVELKDITADAVKVRSSNGGVGASDVRAQLDIETSNGAITLKDCGRPADKHLLDTSNGGISFTGVEGAIKSNTSNAAIEGILGTATGASYDLKTSNGDITLTISEEASAVITASTSNGTVQTPFPADGSDKSKTITLGAGAVGILAETSNASITIHKQ